MIMNINVEVFEYMWQVYRNNYVRAIARIIIIVKMRCRIDDKKCGR